MGWLNVQSVQLASGGANPLVVTVAPTVINNLLVVNVKLGTANVGRHVTSITDNVGNTYLKAIGNIGNPNGTFGIEQWYGVQTTGGATSITINLDGADSIRVQIDESSGGQTTNAAVFDKATSSAGGGIAGTSGSVSLSPTAAGELIAVGVALTSGGTFTAGSNYVIGSQNTNGASQYRLNGTTSETAPITWQNSALWIEVAGAYIPLPTTAIKKISGVVQASVKKVSQVAIASIKKIAGIT